MATELELGNSLKPDCPCRSEHADNAAYCSRCGVGKRGRWKAPYTSAIAMVVCWMSSVAALAMVPSAVSVAQAAGEGALRTTEASTRVNTCNDATAPWGKGCRGEDSLAGVRETRVQGSQTDTLTPVSVSASGSLQTTRNEATADSDPGRTKETLVGRWSVEVGMSGVSGGTTMPCEVRGSGSFTCQDPCGTNSGRISIDKSRRSVELAFTTLCGRARTKTLQYAVQAHTTNELELGRSRDWQRWRRVGAMSPEQGGAGRVGSKRVVESGAPPGMPRGELAPRDQGFEDSTRGRKWGDRCYLHIKAGHYAWAVAACEKGLASIPEQWTEGALLYNLGLIGLKTGNLAAARHYYSESLRVRPTGNSAEVVRKALEEVGASE